MIKQQNKIQKFTLIETVIAVAILAISITTLLAISSSTMMQISKAERAYNEQHELTQAVEYYNIENFTGSITNEFFDLENFNINVYLKESNLELNSNQNINNLWQLRTLNINIKNKKSGRKTSANFDLIMPVKQE
ncbi:hypothetical protein AAEX28_15825 [Lentisphaerota bacterium WC36G]|nr:hypothetical protein LJT99_02585 [Lentisphaerae bacterium WC36]